MYVRMWRHDGSVADRPMRIVELEGGPHAEWQRDGYDRGIVILTAVQMFNDDGTAWSERQSCAPYPWEVWAVYCEADDGPAERWCYRMPVTI
jgi:hypothetical protein